MCLRIVILGMAGSALVACAAVQNPPQFLSQAAGERTVGIYDQADRYLDKQGFPLPGYSEMRFPAGMNESP